MSNGEYNNYSAGGAACSYASLGQYNGDYSMGGVPFQGKVTSGSFIVPTWGAIGYDSLTSKVPSCSGFQNIQSAYGSDAGNCQTTYRTSLCGGNVGSDCASLPPASRYDCCSKNGMTATNLPPGCDMFKTDCTSVPASNRADCCKMFNNPTGCAVPPSSSARRF